MAGNTSDEPASQIATHDDATDPKLLELLVCPFTRMPLIFDAEAKELISRAAGLAFPIRHGVPLMTQDAARPLTDADHKKLSSRTA